MQDQPTAPGGPTEPTLEERVSLLEIALVKTNARHEEDTITLSERIEEVVEAQDRVARSLRGLNGLLEGIASMENRRTDDDR